MLGSHIYVVKPIKWTCGKEIMATYRNPLDEAVFENAPAVPRGIIHIRDHALVEHLAGLEYLDEHE